MRVQLATAVTLKSEREDTTGSVRAMKNAFIHVVLKLMQTENELISDL